MKKPGRQRYLYIIFTLGILLLLIGGGAYVGNRLLQIDSHKDQILAELQKSLKRTVKYDKGSLAFNFGPAFTFTNVKILEKGDTANFITTEKLTFKVALLPLLEKKLVFTEIVLDKPMISLLRDKAGTFNFNDLLEEKPEEITLQIKGIRIKKGQVRLLDLAAGPDPINITLEETDLSLNQLMRGRKCDFRLATYIAGAGKRENITLTGSAKLAGKDKPLRETRVTAAVLAKNLDVERYWPYYSRFVPFKKILGHVDIDSTFKGKLTEFTSKGNIRISSLHFDYPQVFHSVLAPNALQFNYDMVLGPRDIYVKSLDLTIDGHKVKGSCNIRDIRSGDIRITAQATSSTFRLEEFYRYIPYGIIVKGTADFIEQHIKGGLYRLDNGRLDGRISQITHMEKGENYNILAIRGSVEKGLVTYGSGTPSFNNIKGELEIRGKDFLLHRMTGDFGESPFALDGKIADYPLNKPSSYPFEMTITPRPTEVAWLSGKDIGKKLYVSGDSKLRLAGNGTSSNYELSGDWDLTPSTYSYPDMINKPAGRQSQCSFKGSINKHGARLASLQYNLPPLSLEVSGEYRFSGKNQLAVDIKSNQFQIQEVAPLLAAVRRYKPAGKLQAAVQGSSPTGRPADLQWGGTASFSGFSFKPSEQIKTVSNLNGTINFYGTTLESSQLVARLGNSTIYGKGSLVGIKNPILTLAFSAPTLDLADLGLTVPQKEVKASNVQGNLLLKDHNLQIKALSGQIGNTIATIKGTVQDISNPKIDISVSSPHLEPEDLFLLTELEKQGKKEGPPAHVTLKAIIHADSGKVKEINFEKLSSTILFENGILYLQPLELLAFGGHVTGKGRLELDANGSSPRYQLSCSMEKVSVDRLMQAFGINKQQISGTMSLQGEVTAKGRNSVELKTSALGSLKIKCEKGSIKKFAILSKIFSILNVSQLLKFQLPNMISGGMPYNGITADISIRDGITSSQNFFIASDAINISAIGKIDLVKDDLEATICVQPLQTVGKVVNRIPVVGWILTGNNKTFLTTYFEAKGKLEDPDVKAIPVKSMAKGVLNIFIRVFELPAKLITDTGEVLIGK
jgi:uncharacterized protein YhdP